ncbi:MAG: metallophosphoesterase [Acidaminococcaceae bacterium]|nr:metallophosphoesterase [Acidaminococcaceae bacterium]
MSIYAIGDLHFSGEPPSKPMEVFGENWQGHRAKIIKNWQSTVCPDDTVILCGDTSWSMDLPDAIAKDMQAIMALPGKKIMLKGNHDYWWTSKQKMEDLLEHRIEILHNNFYPVGSTAICGTRGWNLPSLPTFTEHDKLIYKREGMRLKASLEQAAAAGCSDIIVALHYPPLYAAGETSVFTDLCEQYHVTHCVYGHVHGQAAHYLNMFQGLRNGTDYRLVACDYVNFELYKVE